jgi:hypothetical protein
MPGHLQNPPRVATGDPLMSAELWNRMAESVDRLNAEMSRLRVGEDSQALSSKPILVELTSFNPDTKMYSGHGLVPGNGAYTEGDLDFAGNIFERKGYVGIELGAFVEVRPAGSCVQASCGATPDKPKKLFSFQFVLPRQMFAVQVSQIGGSQFVPTTSTPASFTYSVANADGHVIVPTNAPIQPERRRSLVYIDPGSGVGYGYYDDAATFHLYDANERIVFEDCA